MEKANCTGATQDWRGDQLKQGFIFPVEPCCEDENGSEEAPPVALVPAQVVVVLPAAKDDGVKDPAIDALGVMLGPPPEAVEGEA